MQGDPHKPPPTDLLNVLRHLSADWRLQSYGYWGMGWYSELAIGKRRFSVINDRGYIEIYEVVGEMRQPIFGASGEPLIIDPKQSKVICQTLINAAAKNIFPTT